MSKSKGEFLTVDLLKQKGYSPMAYRFFCLGSHYRKSLVFSWENLDNAQISYDKLIAKIATFDAKGEAVDTAAFDQLKAKFVNAMDNDLITALAITALYDVLKAKTNDATKIALIADFDKVLSLDLLENAQKLRDAAEKERLAKEALAKAARDAVPAEDRWILDAIDERAAAKKAKDFAKADAIRADLAAKGITLTDTKDGTTWSR